MPPFRDSKRRVADAFRYPEPQQITLDQAHSRLFLPKIGWLRYRNGRTIQGAVKSVTVRFVGCRWLMAVQTEREVLQHLPKATTGVGIDLGVVRFAILSDGTVCEPLNTLKRHADRLRKAYQSFSRNGRRAKTMVQKIHPRIDHVRRNFLHQLSHTIRQNHAMVGIEELQVGNVAIGGRHG